MGDAADRATKAFGLGDMRSGLEDAARQASEAAGAATGFNPADAWGEAWGAATAATAAPTAQGESGEQRGQDQARALVLLVERQSPSQCRPVVDTQPAFRNSSLRGSIPKGCLEGGRADPPQTLEPEDSILTQSPDQLFVDLTKGARRKFGERSASPARGRERPGKNLARASASPCGKAPRRGRTSSPPWRRRPTLGLCYDVDRS